MPAAPVLCRSRLLRTRSARALALGAALALGPATLSPAHAAPAGGVTITSYGHSALLIRGGGATVLLNPFQAVGCAAGLAEPRVSADVILASSRLKDEGAAVANGRLLVKPGSYQVAGLASVSGPPPSGGGSRAGWSSPIWAAPPAGSAPPTGCCSAALTC